MHFVLPRIRDRARSSDHASDPEGRSAQPGCARILRDDRPGHPRPATDAGGQWTQPVFMPCRSRQEARSGLADSASRIDTEAPKVATVRSRGRPSALRCDFTRWASRCAPERVALLNKPLRSWSQTGTVKQLAQPGMRWRTRQTSQPAPHQRMDAVPDQRSPRSAVFRTNAHCAQLCLQKDSD
jgi:hypothetical protein